MDAAIKALPVVAREFGIVDITVSDIARAMLVVAQGLTDAASWEQQLEMDVISKITYEAARLNRNSPLFQMIDRMAEEVVTTGLVHRMVAEMDLSEVDWEVELAGAEAERNAEIDALRRMIFE
jgi:hypothetical protein